MRSFAEIAMARLPDSWVVRLARRGGKPGALMLQPQPVGQGDAAAGRRLAAGLLLFDGRLVETDDCHPWDVASPDLTWSDLLHGHGWLDDAAATDDPEIWEKLSGWVWEWLLRYAGGSGPGWGPELAARRIVRWIGYAIPLVQGQPQERTDLLFRALETHARYLGWRWRRAWPGGDRIEALTGLVYATISMEGAGSAASRAIRMLADETDRTIAADGSIANRNPQELARIVTQLIWIDATIREVGLDADPRVDRALRRAIPVLRTLSGRDGGLARFHGGRSARGARLEETLARGPAVLPSEPNPAMGYLRLKAGQSIAIVDAAAAPAGHGAATGHCSALAFEFAHAGQHIVVNQGSGLGFGAEPAAQARRRPAHSSIELGGMCPGELRPAPSPRFRSRLICPGRVSGRAEGDGRTAWALCESTEYEPTLGLIVERRLDLDGEGPCLSGEDTALAARAETRARFAERFGDGPDRCPMVLRFHLHPDIRATQTTSAPMVGLILPDNSRWVFRTDAAEVSLAPSRYYERARPMPRAALQIVATSYLIDFWGRIAWSFRQINEGPVG